MALKDLVISQRELTEEQIEELIEPLLRYDASTRQLVLLPPAAELQNRQRVIAYLIGLLGWPLVLPEDPPATAMTPAELAEVLKIPGGSLRPILKALKDERLIQVKDGKYSVSHVTFPFLKEQLQGKAPAPQKSRKRRKATTMSQEKRRSNLPGEQSEQSGPAQEESSEGVERPAAKRRGTRDATAAGFGPLERVRQLIGEGWFATPRSVRDIVSELASRGATYRGQDLTRQMQTLVRKRELTRSKAAQGGSGREVWHYQTP